MSNLLYPRNLKNWRLERAKTPELNGPGLNDRKRSLYCLILPLFRSFNRGGFRAAPNANFSGFLGIKTALRSWFFLAVVAFSSLFAGEKVVLFNDTSAWYHWGCTATSTA